MCLLSRRIIRAEQKPHLEGAGHPLVFRTGPTKGKGRGQSWRWISQPEKVTGCNGCLRESRAKLVCSPRAARRLLATACQEAGFHAAPSRTAVWTFESRRKTLERVSPWRNTAARLNFQRRRQRQRQQPAGDREEEPTGPRYYHPLVSDSLSTWDSVCVQVSARAQEPLHLEGFECVTRGHGHDARE